MYPRKQVLRTHFSSKSSHKCKFLKFYDTEKDNTQVFVLTAQNPLLPNLYFTSDNSDKMFIGVWTRYSVAGGKKSDQVRKIMLLKTNVFSVAVAFSVVFL